MYHLYTEGVLGVEKDRISGFYIRIRADIKFSIHIFLRTLINIIEIVWGYASVLQILVNAHFTELN